MFDLPENIKQRYTGFASPYRQIIADHGVFAACDYSDQIPAWHLEQIYPNFDVSKTVITQSIEYAEKRQFYHFYYIVAADQLEQYTEAMSEIDARYQITIEEKIPANEKPVNVLFWDWLYDTTCRQYDTVVVLHSLPQIHRGSVYQE